MGRTEEFGEKQKRLNEYMRRKGLEGILLSNQANFAWFTCGGDNHVVTASESGVGTILVTPDKYFLVANNIEAHRIAEEELQNLVGPNGHKESIADEFDVLPYLWYEESHQKDATILRAVEQGCGASISSGRVASDDGVANTPLVDSDFAELRYSLTDNEIEKYRWLGASCSEAMEEACFSVEPGDTEYQIGAKACKAFYDRCITPTVILVAADDRTMKYRHPIMTDKKLKEHVMVVMCGRRWGLIVSLTRLIHFDPLPEELKRKHEAVVAVDAAFNLASKPGTAVCDILQEAIEVYRQTGFSDEWKLHHQGGPTGYAGRDYKATPTEKRMVQLKQAFAWNPSIAGTKSEDTVIAFDDRIEIISEAQKWPVITTEYKGQKIERPNILVT